IPFAPLNALTGRRSLTPEDYRRSTTTLRQGLAPVPGVFPAGTSLCLLGAGLQAVQQLCLIARASRHAAPDAWAQLPVSWHATVPFSLRIQVSHQAHRQPPPVRARCAGDTSSAPRGALVVHDAPVFGAVDPDDVVVVQVLQAGPVPGFAPAPAG